MTGRPCSWMAGTRPGHDELIICKWVWHPGAATPCAAILALTLSTSLARAQSVDYSLFNPAPDDALRPFCTDRPTKGTGPCTVDAGHLQIESDIFNATLQNSDGVVTDTWLYTDPNLKLGISENLDVELSVSPYVEIVTHDHRSGERTDIAGFGDMVLRAKTSLAGNGQGPFSAALDPYLKLPTAASGIGNGAVEGGLVLPLQFALSDAWSLSLAPEGDLLKNSADDGRHAAGAAALGLTRTINSQVSASGEFWVAVNGDPSGTSTQDSFDVAAAWQPPGARDLQFDAGANFGLNDQTPAVQLYMGISQRF